MLTAMFLALFGCMAFVVAPFMEKEEKIRFRLVCVGGTFLGLGVLIAIANLL